MVNALVPLAVLLLVVYITCMIFKRLRLIHNIFWIPGPPAWPILGNYLQLIGVSPEVAFENMNKFYKKYGKTYKVWVGATPVIHCQDPEILKLIYKQEERNNKANMYVLSRQYLGPGLLMCEGDEKWRIQRKYLSNSFHSDLLTNNVELTWKKIHKLIEILDQTENYTIKNKPMDLVPLMKRAFLDVSVGSVVGVVSKSLEEPDLYPYLDAIESMSEIVMARTFSTLLKFDFIFEASPLKKTSDKVLSTMKTFIRTLINERVEEEHFKDAGKHKKIADAMLRLQKEEPFITSEDVESQVSNNIMAAYDTLSTVSSLLVFILGNDDKLQEKVLNEIKEVAPNLLQDGFSIVDINKCQLLDRCLKETMRMFPPAPMIGRILNQSIATRDGVLPAGIDIYTNLYNYHRDEEAYPNSDRFDPDRFLPEEMNQRHPLSWIPFGFGIRSCIGQKTAILQSKVAVAMMILKYSIKSYEDVGDLKMSANLVMKSKNGIRVLIKPRM